jgi:cellulose synthase (UDP-forming)
MITAYAVPHIFHASLTNSRMQGRFRHSFWNEVYESVLAWYILRPALVAFVNPKAGKFNVTDKGGVTEEGYFDWDMARPYIVLLVLNLAGFLVGAGRLVFQESPDVATVLINLAWTVYNLIMTSAAVAVAGETRQVRRSPRVATALPASLMFGNGKTLACQTIDFSQTGLGLRVPADADVPMDELLHVSLYRGTEEGIFPATAAFRRGDHLGLQFKDLNVQQEVELAQMTFARADTWAQAWGSHERDSLPTAFAEILRIAVKGFWDLARSTGRLALFWRRDRRAIPSIPETGDQ